MISKMPAKPADEEKEKEEVKNEDDSNEEKKDSFDKMFDSVGATNNDDKNEGDASGDEEKKDSTEDGDETKPEGEESTKDGEYQILVYLLRIYLFVMSALKFEF